MKNTERCPSHAVVLGKVALHISGTTLNILCCKLCASGKDGKAIYLHYVDGGFTCPFCHAQPQTKEGIVSNVGATFDGDGDVQLVNRWRAYKAGKIAGEPVRIAPNMQALQQRAEARNGAE